jgi:uncharacterized membrane protein YvlD (DUF360 family)
VFFANHILPGIHVSDLTKIPHLGADLLFSVGLGLVNSLIYPILRIFNQNVSCIRIAALVIILNFIVYASLKLVSIGIQIVTLEGYLLVSVTVSLGSFILNYLEMKHCVHVPKNDDPGSSQ